MKFENSLERNIRIKVGLIFLVVILYFLGVFIYSHNLKHSMNTQKEEIAHSYTILAQSNHLITSVQQAQNIINMYLGSPQKINHKQYDSISADIHRQITSIKELSKQREQHVLLANIDSLLNEKNAIVKKLIRQFNEQNPLQKLNKRIETSYEDIVKDSVIATTRKDTTLVVKEKKSFWSRVKGLFNPKHVADTTINITSTREDTLFKSRIDTLVYGNLKNISQEASQTYSLRIKGIEKQVKDLILAEQGISLQISQLLSQFYNQTVQTLRIRMEKSEELTQKVFTFAIVVGAFSLLLIATIILLIANDLKKGQKARQELAQEKQRTESLMESRHKLLLSVSHDIKTPLSSMMGYMQMWEHEEISPKKQQQLLSAQSSGKYMLNMLSNLLEFSRLEQNSGKLHNSRFNLIELIDEITGMFRPLTQDKNLEITFENQAETPFYIETDHTILKQILTNIISNAVKYTPKGSVHILLEHGKNTVFTITDTGIGIDKEHLDKICLPFSRIHNSLKAEGSGFGMYVTKGLIDSLKGHIAIMSEKGKGTSVRISLPFRKVRKDETMFPHKSMQPTEQKQYRNILIFEDDKTLGNMISEFLSQKGYHVSLCTVIEDAKELLNAVTSFDIAFTDMEMRNITGKDILHAIRRRGSKIPVWLMTAHDDYTQEAAIEDGFSGFIAKPIRMNVFAEILSEEKLGINTPAGGENFSSLATLFGDDKETIREILTKFVETATADTQQLTGHITAGKFTEAQQLCHKMHPFLSQLDADDLCPVLRKMDALRGQNETAYPAWKEELSDTIEKIREFVKMVKRDYL